MSFTRALTFLRDLGRDLDGPEATETQLTVGPGGRRTPTDVYEPPEPALGTVVTVHGMTPLAQRDPRFVQLNRALARAGFRVVSPCFPGIADLRIDPRDADAIAEALRSTALRPALAPTGRVSAFSVSFSAGLTLIAAGREAVADRVDAVGCLGTYGRITTTLHALLAGRLMDAYGRLVVLASFIEASIGEAPAVAEAFRTAALDNWHARKRPHLPEALARLEPADQRMVRRLLVDPTERLWHWTRIQRAIGDLVEAASVVDQLAGVQARVTLVHGRGDDVIPAGESREVARSLRRAGKACRLLITPLVGHGDARLTWRNAVHAPALAATFGGFLADVAGAGRRGPRPLLAPLSAEAAQP